jgi:hypothetical protein
MFRLCVASSILYGWHEVAAIVCTANNKHSVAYALWGPDNLQPYNRSPNVNSRIEYAQSLIYYVLIQIGICRLFKGPLRLKDRSETRFVKIP